MPVLAAFAHVAPGPGAAVQRPASPTGTSVAPKLSRFALTGVAGSSGCAPGLRIVTSGEVSETAGELPAMVSPKNTYTRPACAHTLPGAAAHGDSRCAVALVST